MTVVIHFSLNAHKYFKKTRAGFVHFDVVGRFCVECDVYIKNKAGFATFDLDCIIVGTLGNIIM